MDERPLGWVELQQAFGAKGKYGKWLRQHDTVAKIGDTLFLHGGISPKYATLQVSEFNTRVKDALASPTPFADPLMTDPDGPLWYRGLALAPEAELAAHVDALLAFHGVSRIVVGHTIAPGVVLPRFGGKVILNDVGLSSYLRRSALVSPDRAWRRVGAAPRHVDSVAHVTPTSQRTSTPSGRSSLAESRLRAWMARGAVWPLPVVADQQ